MPMPTSGMQGQAALGEGGAQGADAPADLERAIERALRIARGASPGR